MRIDIDVPYEDRELAKRLGARWDAGARTWYFEAGTTLSKILTWFPSDRRPGAINASPSLSAADAWKMLPPRHTNPHVLYSYVISRNPASRLRRGGFCHYCDSQTADWMLNNTELWHMASIEFGLIRPTELEIITQALESGELLNRESTLAKVFRIFARFPR